MKKTWKRVLCVFAAVVTAFACSAAACAKETDTHLTFDQNGNFEILHLTDWHTVYPMPQAQKQYVKEALNAAAPDLVILGGDMSEASEADQPAAVKEICDLLIEADVPFAITFGNHDYLHNLSIDAMFALYKQYGGAYCLSEDEDPALSGCGTCSIPVYTHGGSRIAYSIYCFDSGCEVPGGYDAVRPDQIGWYQRRAEGLKQACGGQYVPSVVFQHIIVQEIYDAIWPVAKESDRLNVMRYDGKAYKKKAIPNISRVRDGYIMEHPCPGYYNHGELDAMRANGDVRAIFCGHDHTNSFTVEIGGIDIVNTPSVKPHTLFKKLNWGGRVITLHEDGAYESRVLPGYVLAERPGSVILSSGALSRAELAFTKVWKALVDVSVPVWSRIAERIYRF